MNYQTIRRLVLRGLAVAGLVMAAASPTTVMAQGQEQYFGIPSSRVGPYSAMALAITAASSTI